MVKFLSSWIEGIVIAVIIASMFEMIIPNGNIKKYIKIILGIYVIFSIISPFVDSKALYSLDLSEVVDNYSENIIYDEEQGTSENDLNKIYKNTFEKEIIRTVENEGFVVYKCNVQGVFDAEKDDAGISKIEIVLESKQETKKQSTSDEENSIKIQNVNEIERVEISVGAKTLDENDNKITAKDIDTLKKFLSNHYEVEKSIISIKVR